MCIYYSKNYASIIYIPTSNHQPCPSRLYSYMQSNPTIGTSYRHSSSCLPVAKLNSVGHHRDGQHWRTRVWKKYGEQEYGESIFMYTRLIAHRLTFNT